MTWLSIRKYCKEKKIKHPEIVYNQIYTGKLKKDVDWREVDTVVRRKEVWYE